MNKFGKVLLPFITPFKTDESVDLEKFKMLIDYAIRNDLFDTIIVTGTTGEFNTLSFEERLELFKSAKEVAGDKFPVIAGTGCASTRETIKLTKAACKLGIETCMVVCPYYCKPTQIGIFEHFKRVVDETDVDILIYNIPIFTGVNIEPATVGELVKYSSRFIGIKDESGVNPTQIMDYSYATKEFNPNFLLFNGDDIMLMPTLALGAIGIVSGGALILGDVIKKVFENYEQGNVNGALENYRVVYEMVRCFCRKGRINPNPMLRAAVTMTIGIEIGPARMPLDAPSADDMEEIRKFTSKLKEYRKDHRLI
jgi:4-hydroxy-tetrahydrodipicolinate synthase